MIHSLLRLREKDVLYLNPGDSLDGFEIEGDWATKTIDGVSYITDSPNGDYENNSHTALTSPVFEATSSETILRWITSMTLKKATIKVSLKLSLKALTYGLR